MSNPQEGNVSETKVFSFDELKSANGKHYDQVEAYGGQVAIGSLGSGDMLEWLETNDDPAAKKEAGLRLLVKSVVDPETKSHLPKDAAAEWLAIFREKDARENGKVIKAILKLNGLDKAAKTLLDDPKGDSSVATSGASPSASPSPAGV